MKRLLWCLLLAVLGTAYVMYALTRLGLVLLLWSCCEVTPW